MGIHIYPILSEESFRFPTTTFVEEHRAIASTVTDDPEFLLQAVKDIFAEIAVVFQPSRYDHTEQIISAKALQVYTKLAADNQAQKTSTKNSDSRKNTTTPAPTGSEDLERPQA